ncbi:hypothetical protein [Dysgonomonas sp. ZJ709]|uniref:hypothetical protein n=1 Tax=Dysgonomonas sp. ZJ709 TaxID=2709797 RepID=UPI0013ED5DDA|nr:hypothetical protein [Dysgonomonas sp. ZJ709]
MEKLERPLSVLIELLPQYRLVNSLYWNTINESKLSFHNQCLITGFYNEFKDTLIFDKTILNFILTTDKGKQLQIIESFRIEIERNMEAYTNNNSFFDKLDTYNICAERPDPFPREIEIQLQETNNIWQKLKELRGNLEAESWKGNKTATDRLFKEEEDLDKLYKAEQKKLNILYQKKKKSDSNASKYAENLFAKIHQLSTTFQTIINSYFPVQQETVESPTPDIEPEENPITEQLDDSNEPPITVKPTIEADMIFRSDEMYNKFQKLEQKLITDKYLDENLIWISRHDNRTVDIKSLVTFLVGLVENRYFLPNKDPKIKIFFETRYTVTIGQNFERQRRIKYLNEYQTVFFEYKF